MKPIEYYSEVPVAYPKRETFQTIYVYDKGECLWRGAKGSIPLTDLRQMFPDGLIQEVTDKEAYQEAQKAYNATTAKLFEEFRKDLFEFYGLSDHPKRNRCFDIAWGLGHSSGYSEVLNYFDVLVELIQD